MFIYSIPSGSSTATVRYFYNGSSFQAVNHITNVKTKYEINSATGKGYIDDVEVVSFSTGNVVSNLSIGLFMTNNNGSYYGGYGKLYSCKIYDNDVLIRDFIPVLDESNVACLYEEVEGKFYYNAGTGTFTAGSATGQPVPTTSVARKIKKAYVGVNTLLYTRLNFAESTGTQYIDTGVVPKSTSRMVLDYAATDITVEAISGWGASGGAEAFFAGNRASTVTNPYFYAYSSATYTATYTDISPDTQRHVWDISNAALKFDDVTYGTGTIGNTATTGQTLHLFGLHSEWSPYNNPKPMRIYGCKIYDGDTLIKDYIPVKDTNNVVCLLDLVSNTFVYNNGTGTFVAGTEETPVTMEVARKIKKGYVGVNGVAQMCYGGGVAPSSTVVLMHLDGSIVNAVTGTTSGIDVTYYQSTGKWGYGQEPNAYARRICFTDAAYCPTSYNGSNAWCMGWWSKHGSLNWGSSTLQLKDTSNYWRAFVSFGSSGGYMMASFSSDGCNVSNKTDYQTVTQADFLNNSDWNYFAVQIKGGKISVYINGLLVTDATFNSFNNFVDKTTPKMLMSDWGNGYSVDEVIVARDDIYEPQDAPWTL